MINFTKKIIQYFLVYFYAKKNKVYIDNKFHISYKAIKNCKEGSKFLGNVICHGEVQIGKYSSINGPATRISAKINKIIIGNFCSIASGVVIQEYYHKYDRITSYFIHKNIFKESLENDIFSKGDIIIEDDVWIGSNSVILSGVIIGRGSIVGAGSIVTKDIPPYSIVAGNPAKVLKKRFNADTIEYLERIQWWTWDVQKIILNKELFNLCENEINKNFISRK